VGNYTPLSQKTLALLSIILDNKNIDCQIEQISLKKSTLISKKIEYTKYNRGAIMLQEYREEISQLKQENAHFAKIFEKHNELDQKAKDADEGRMHLSDAELEVIKKEKLMLKDEALRMILDYKKSQS